MNILATVERREDGRWIWKSFGDFGIEPSREYSQKAAFDPENMTPSQIDHILWLAGYAPDEVGQRMESAAKEALAKVFDSQTPAELVRRWRDQDKPGRDADGEEVGDDVGHV